jgi:hypothetical protein
MSRIYQNATDDYAPETTQQRDAARAEMVRQMNAALDADKLATLVARLESTEDLAKAVMAYLDHVLYDVNAREPLPHVAQAIRRYATQNNLSVSEAEIVLGSYA